MRRFTELFRVYFPAGTIARIQAAAGRAGFLYASEWVRAVVLRELKRQPKEVRR